MKKIYLLTVLFAVCFSAHSQSKYPGGVSGVSVWTVAQQDASGSYGWVDMLSNSAVTAGSGIKLNFNPSSYFDGDKNRLTFPLDKSNRDFFSIFIVFGAPANSLEQTVWSVEKLSKTALVMTTHRLGNIEQYEYINHTNISEPQYRIFTCTLSEPDTTDSDRQFKIGVEPSDIDIPVKNFKGYIPEIIFYNRVLNFQERRRVESYLAVKYGISLDQSFPAPYLNSRGNVIWSSASGAKFDFNITAIGRDDCSGLLQTVSTSSNAPGLLQMRLLNKENLPDNNFLFWSDDGGDLQFIPQNGHWKQLGRSWRVTTAGNISSYGVVQSFDLSLLSNRFLGSGERYALMIDRSGSGSFPIGETSFVEAVREKDALIFPNIVWDNKSGLSEGFSLVVVPELFARFGIDNPSCGENNGKLQVEINGGTPPYSIQLAEAEHSVGIASITSNASLHTFDKIYQGCYTFIIKDAKGNVYSETLGVENKEMRSVPLASHYMLKRGETLILDAFSPEASFYEWQMPDGVLSYSSEIIAEQAGTYLLLVRNSAGCESSKRIKVSSFDSNFSRISQFPNPTSDGYFWLDIGLYQAGDVDLRIYDVSGVLVSQSKLGGSSYYLYKGYLPRSGHYIIQAESNGSREIVKLIRR
jgi:hypothetical protein